MDTALADRLYEEIHHGLDSRAIREPRWKDCRDAYDNELGDPGFEPYEGAYCGHFNLIQVKIDQMAASVVGTLFAREPWFTAVVHDDNESQVKLEKVLQFFLERGKFKEAVKSVAKPAGYHGIGWVRAEWDGKNFEFDALEADATIVYPAWAKSLEQAKTYGHCYYLRKSQIVALQKEGVYKPGEVTPGDDSDNEGSGSGRPIGDQSREEDARIRCWDLITEIDGKKERVVFAEDSKLVLFKEPWNFENVWYGEFTYKPKRTKDGYYPSSWPARDLMQCQLDINETTATMRNGARFNAYGATFVNGTADSTSPVIKTEPGGVYNVDTDGMMMFNPKVDMGVLPSLIGLDIEHADRIVRVSNSASGQQAVGVDTATEATIMASGQQQSIDEYIETFYPGAVAIVKFVCETLKNEWGKWFPTIGKALGLSENDAGIFDIPVLWRPSVASIGGTPQAQQNMAMMLWSVAADPESGIDKYELASRLLDSAEQMGFTNAEGLQYPKTIDMAAERLAQEFGLNPDYVDAAIAEAANLTASDLAEGMGGMDGAQVPQGLPGGVGAEDSGMSQGDGVMSAGQDTGLPGEGGGL